jgi:hypothetical protein
MAVILDIIFSLVFGSALLVIVLTANDIANENYSLYNGDVIVQEMLVSTAELVEGELRNMGFGVPEKKQTVLEADTARIKFLTDLDRNGNIDTITYFVGDTTELSQTQNRLDRYLHRKVNNAMTGKVGVVTQWKLRYITAAGEVLPTPVDVDRLTEIHIVELTMEVQNPYAQLRKKGEVGAGQRDALYSSSFWQQTRLASQNLRR